MQCYATKNLVKEDFILHRSNTKRCPESIKDATQISRGLQKIQNLDDLLTF